MENEQLSQSDMRTILESEHGVIFFPKRQFRIPIVSDTNLSTIIDPENTDYVKMHVRHLNNFLRRHAVGDSFGNNHDARVRWIAQMTKKYGDVFLEIYFNNNQFRAVSLGVVNFAIQNLQELVPDALLQDRLAAIDRELSDAVTGAKTGKNYNQIDDLQEKLAIVHLFEDRSLEVLRLLTPTAQSGKTAQS